jgi:hypothetical protein
MRRRLFEQWFQCALVLKLQRLRVIEQFIILEQFRQLQQLRILEQLVLQQWFLIGRRQLVKRQQLGFVSRHGILDSLWRDARVE